MIFTLVANDGEPRRIVANRSASIFVVFTETEDGWTTIAAEPGWVTYPWEFERYGNAVLRATLEEAGRRLDLPAEEVRRLRFAELEKAADPDLPPEYRYASRSRAPNRRFARGAR